MLLSLLPVYPLLAPLRYKHAYSLIQGKQPEKHQSVQLQLAFVMLLMLGQIQLLVIIALVMDTLLELQALALPLPSLLMSIPERK